MKHLIVGMIVLSINYGKFRPLPSTSRLHLLFFIINDPILAPNFRLVGNSRYRFEPSFAYQRREQNRFP